MLSTIGKEDIPRTQTSLEFRLEQDPQEVLKDQAEPSALTSPPGRSQPQALRLPLPH